MSRSAALLVVGTLFATPALAGGTGSPLPCGYTIEATDAQPSVPTCTAIIADQVPRQIEPNTSQQLSYGVGNSLRAIGSLTGPYEICLPIPWGVSLVDADNPEVYIWDNSAGRSTAQVPGTPRTTAVTGDANVTSQYCVPVGTNRMTLDPGDVLYVGVDLTYSAVAATNALHYLDDGTPGYAAYCDGLTCNRTNLQRLDQPVKDYVEDLQGCGFEFWGTRDTPTAPTTCADSPGPQTAPRFNAGDTTRLTYGELNPIQTDAATLTGEHRICLPIPVGVSYANETLYYTAGASTTEVTDLNTVWTFDGRSADSVKQGDLCVTSELPTDFRPGEKLWASVDITFPGTSVTFGDENGNPGTVRTDCTGRGGNANVCPDDTLPLLTVEITPDTAVIDACGFTVLDVSDTPTVPTCADGPGVQTEFVEPNSDVQLVYGAGVPVGIDNAILPGVFDICLPLPNGLTPTDPHLYVTDSSGTTTELLSDFQFAIDSSAADANIQGNYCMTYGGSTLLEPGAELWISVDLSVAQTDVTFTAADGTQGTVLTDCTLPGGTGDVCPRDFLPALTLEIIEYNADLQGCGFDFYATTDTPLTPRTCADFPSPQTGPSLNPGESRKLAYGMLNPDLRQAATLTGNYSICLPLPIGVTWANAELWHTPTGQISADALTGTWVLDTQDADTVKQGDLCVTSRAPAVLEPGDVLWASVNLTFGSSTATFGDDVDTPGAVLTDCLQPGGNATACPEDSLPLLTVPILGAPQVLVEYSSGRSIQTSEDGTSDRVLFKLSRQPGADVIFNVISTDVTEGVVSGGAVITITRAGWDTGTSVTLDGVDDDLVDGNQTFGLTRTATVSADRIFDGIAEAEILWNNADNDSAGATVAPLAVATSESGTTADFTVVLDAEPSDTTTIAITGLDTTEGSLSTSSLTFEPSNWDVAQTVTVTGVDDAAVDGPITYTLALGAMSSNDAAFDRVDVDDVDVTNADDDTPGFTVTTTTGTGDAATLSTSESGTTDTMRFVLNTTPTDTVTIPVSSSDLSEGTVPVTELVFTTGNWNVPQDLVVTGADDSLVDGDITFDLIIGTVTSNDTDYAGIDPNDVEWVNVDDDTADVVFDVDPTETLITTEGGGFQTFTVALSSEPTDTVDIPVSSSDASEGSITGTLSFDTGNWDTPQTITVTGVDDVLQDGDIDYTVVLGAMVSNDSAFSGLDLDDVPARNMDDDTAGVRVTPTAGTTTEAGGTQEVAIVLTAAPAADVTVSLASSDTSEGTVSAASVVFTSLNWSTTQRVTVTGQDDALVDGDVAYTVTTTVSSGDGNYDALAADDVDLVNQDDDVGGLTIDNGTPAVLSTNESGTTDTFDVALSAEPTADVTLALSVGDGTEGSVAPASLTFTAGNWDTAQTVTVTGLDDTEVDGDITWTLTLTASSSDTTVDGAIDTVEVTNIDNDVAGITVNPIAGLETDESGATDTFDVVLNTAPSADVVIAVTSLDTGEGLTDVTQLTFTTANWSTAQTVTVTGVDDALDDGDVDYVIELAAATSADQAYSGMDASDVDATNLDDGADAGDTGITDSGLDDSGLTDSEDIWVQGGCSCKDDGEGSGAWLLGLLLLPLLRRRDQD